MKKLIQQVLKSSGVSGKVAKDSSVPRFRVYDNRLTLEGTIKGNKYSMRITDDRGREVDTLSVNISDSNSLVNRINESLDTLKMLSKVYENTKLTEEDEEFDTVDAEDETADSPKSLEDGLSELYANIIAAAESVQALKDIVSYDDAETISTLISFESSLYDTAIDVDDFLSDLLPNDDEEVEESVKVSKTNKQRVLENLSVSAALIKKDKSLSDIYTALRDIKAELTVRGV